VYTVCIEKSRDKNDVQYHLGKFFEKNREKCEKNEQKSRDKGKLKFKVTLMQKMKR
jgi:hypothetical protein